jgi:tetratricopeptide (TPR) repeat protein
MKPKSFAITRALVVCALAVALAADAFAQDKNKAPQVSKGEQDAMMKVQSAADPAAKLKAADEFIKKYPKSTNRANVVSHVIDAINNTQDQAQKITLLESALTVFKEPADSDIIAPVLLNAYIAANRVDDAFAFAEKALAKNPNDVATLTQVTVLGTNQAKQRNGKYVPQSQQYGARAIQIIEAGNKPAGMTDESWKEYQTRWLPQLYQELGLLAMMTGNNAESKTRLEKAATLNPDDAITFYLLGSLLNDDYQKLAENYQKQAAGPLKDQLLKEAQGKMDEIIEMWAHALGLAQGNAQYQSFADQLRPELENYYKYRHGGSTKGLDEMVAKYKKQ